MTKTRHGLFFSEDTMEQTTQPIRRRLTKYNKDPVRLTALLYLKEALLAENYEDCGLFVAVAREFGAEEREIKALLEDPRRNPF